MPQRTTATGIGTGTALAALAIYFASPVQAQRTRSTSTASSLCQAAEQPLFQCRIGRRQVALCAGGGAEGERYVQYRYGRPGRVELAFPERGRAGLSWARIGYSGGGEMQVNFTNEGRRHVLYSRMVRTRFDGVNNAPRFSAGVAVIRGDRTIFDQQCSDTDDPWIVEAPTERLLPQGQPTDWSALLN